MFSKKKKKSGEVSQKYEQISVIAETIINYTVKSLRLEQP